MGWAAVWYRYVGRRFSTTLVAASAGVFGLDLLMNRGPDAYWNTINKGKQWKEIKPIVEARFAEAKEQREMAAGEDTEEEVQQQQPEPEKQIHQSETGDTP